MTNKKIYEFEYNENLKIIENSFNIALKSFNIEKSIYEIGVFTDIKENHLNEIKKKAINLLTKIKDVIINVLENENYIDFYIHTYKNPFLSMILALPVNKEKVFYSVPLVFTFLEFMHMYIEVKLIKKYKNDIKKNLSIIKTCYERGLNRTYEERYDKFKENIVDNRIRHMQSFLELDPTIHHYIFLKAVKRHIEGYAQPQKMIKKNSIFTDLRISPIINLAKIIGGKIDELKINHKRERIEIQINKFPPKVYVIVKYEYVNKLKI